MSYKLVACACGLVAATHSTGTTTSYPKKKASWTVERTQMLVTTPATSTVAIWRSRKSRIKVGAKERAIAAFGHENVLGCPMHGVHEVRTPSVDETVRDTFLKQGIIGTQPLIRIKDGEVGCGRGIY